MTTSIVRATLGRLLFSGDETKKSVIADMFGTQFVGAIHGRLLTAWSTAGIIGPVVVNYIREAQLAAAYNRAIISTTPPCTSSAPCWSPV